MPFVCQGKPFLRQGEPAVQKAKSNVTSLTSEEVSYIQTAKAKAAGLKAPALHSNLRQT
jgi:hypothetical protein